MNEQHGHATGDRILREVAAVNPHAQPAQRLAVRLVEQEVAARYGADVFFALILPETARGNAATKLESVRRAVNALTIASRACRRRRCRSASRRIRKTAPIANRWCARRNAR